MKSALPPTVGGTTANLMPKMNWATKPMTKIGTAMMNSDTTSTVESNQPPLRRPATTPKPMPKIVSITSAISASLIVTGKASARTSVTGRPENVWPKSNWKMPPTYMRYCTRNGLSRL